MKKYRKFIYILTVFVLIVVIFCNLLTASALTSYNFVISRPQVTSNSCYFEIVTESSGTYLFYVSAAVDVNCINSSTYDMEKISIYFDSVIVDGSLWVYPVKITSLDESVNLVVESYQIYGTIITQDGRFIDASYSSDIASNTSGRNSAGFYIGRNYQSLRAYNAKCASSGSSDAVFVYANEINTNDKLDKIYGAISGGNDEIKANQDKNANEIKQNQDKNAESIKNGWKSDKDIDTSTTDDYAAKEKEIMDSTSEGRQQASFLFGGFQSLIDGDYTFSLGKGLLVASSILTQFDQIKWLNVLINFSLSIGIFAFIIGTVQLVVNKSSAAERYHRKKSKK